MKRRMYVGKLLDADNELDAITRRQEMRVIDRARLPLPPLPRDWRLTTAAICMGVILSAMFVGLLIAVVTAR